jgi:Protein of unknown function (DUF3800)
VSKIQITYRWLMLLAYVDESSTKDWYFMAALLCDGPGIQGITAGLDLTVERATRDYGVAEDAELHGYELFQGEGWWRGVPPRARIGVYNDAFETISEHCDAIILRGIHTEGQRRRYAKIEPAHSWVLSNLLEQIHDHVTTCALVIADEVGDQAIHRADLAFYQNSGTLGYRARKLTRIIDTLHFAPSHASRLLQAVDLVVYLHRRIETHIEPTERGRRANERLWKRIGSKVVHQRCWYPLPRLQQDARRPHHAGEA